MNIISNKRTYFTLLRITGIVLFIAIIYHFNPISILRKIRNAQAKWLILGILLQINVLLLKGLRWHLLKSSSFHIIEVVKSMGQCLESYAIGVVTPGRVGEFLKIGHSKSEGKSALRSGFWVLSERGQDVSLFIAVAALAILSGDITLVPEIWGYLLLTTAVSGLVISSALLISRQLSRLTESLVTRLTKRTFKLPSERISVLRLSIIIVLSTLATFSYFLSCHCLAIGVGLTSSLLLNAGTVSLAGLLTMLPITIMGLGTREVTFLFIFKGIDKSLVLAFSSLVFLVAQVGGAVFAFALGYLCLFIANRRKA